MATAATSSGASASTEPNTNSSTASAPSPPISVRLTTSAPADPPSSWALSWSMPVTSSAVPAGSAVRGAADRRDRRIATVGYAVVAWEHQAVSGPAVCGDQAPVTAAGIGGNAGGQREVRRQPLADGWREHDPTNS